MAWGMLAAGCASPGAAGAGPPSSGWHEITTEHLRIDTDLSLDDAREGAALLEQLYQAILAAAWNGAALPRGEPIQLVVFFNGVDFERIYGRHLWSVYRGGANARLVTYGRPSRWEFRSSLNPEGKSNVVVHGMTSILASRFYRSAPAWFLSGVGSYFETLEVDGESGKVVFGKVNMDEYRSYRSIRSLTLAQLMQWRGGKHDNQKEREGYEALSWATVYWLINARPAGFNGLSQAFVRGTEQDTAWRQALPGLGVAEADVELNQYMKHGNYGYGEASVAKASRALAERLLSQFEVDAMLRDLAASFSK